MAGMVGVTSPATPATPSPAPPTPTLNSAANPSTPAGEETTTKKDFSNIPGAFALQQPDAILTPAVDAELDKFLKAGGTDVDAFDLLCDSYEGVPDMISTVESWAPIVNGRGNANGNGNSPPNVNSNGGVAPGFLERALEEVLEENEADIVARVDAVMHSAERAPEFLHELYANPRWAGVIRRIGEKHRNSALFNFLARAARLKDAGIAHDVVEAPHKFLNALSEAVALLFQKDDITMKDLTVFYTQIRSLAAYDEACAVISMRLFASLSRETIDPFTRGLFRRTAQEIRSESITAMQAVAGIPDNIALQFVQRLAIVLESVAARNPVPKRLLDALVGILSPERVAQRGFISEVALINNSFEGLFNEKGPKKSADEEIDDITMTGFQAMSPEEAARREVLLGMLCHAEVFQAIMRSLFTHAERAYRLAKNGSKAVDEKRRDCLAMLMSYAGTILKVPSDEVVAMLQDKTALKKLRVECLALGKKLREVAIVCEDLVPGCPRFKFKGKNVTTLVENLDDPIIAGGLLGWVEEGLKGGEDERTLLVTSPKHLAFLEGICEKHKRLRDQALGILHVGFSRKYAKLNVLDAEKLRDMYLESLVSMVPLYEGPAVVDLFLECYTHDGAVDDSHLRRFVKELLRMIAPPYSREFTHSVARLLSMRRIKDATTTDPEAVSLTSNFWNEVGQLTYSEGALGKEKVKEVVALEEKKEMAISVDTPPGTPRKSEMTPVAAAGV